jgi:histidine triad (HIT) family protein
MADCIFCGLANGPEAKLVYRDEKVAAFNDINPGAPVHVLVVPRQHVSSVEQVHDADLLAALFAAGHRVAADRGIAKSGYRLVFNVGPDALQSVFHVHLHVIGGRRLGWPPG